MPRTRLSCGMAFSGVADIAAKIDHALLRPTLTADEIATGCRDAREWGVASACVLPWCVDRAASILEGSDTVVCTVIGFPLGGHTPAVKLAEAERAIADGASELDVVVNQSGVLGGDWQAVRTEIAGLTALAHERARKIKVIFENCNLDNRHKIYLCEVCTELDVDWVKTSTGFGAGGATLDDLRLMSDHTRPPVEIKASGGIRDLSTLLDMCAIERVTRIGTSSTAAILAAARQLER